MNGYPTLWQKKTIWAALSTLAVVTIGAVSVGLIWLISQVLGFLQPILIPFAVAGVMAYLLDPLVSKLVSWGTSRQRAVLCVFAFVSISFVGILLWVVPVVSSESVQLAHRLPKLTEDARRLITNFAKDIQQKYNIQLLPDFPAPDTSSTEGARPTGVGAANPTVTADSSGTAAPAAVVAAPTVPAVAAVPVAAPAATPATPPTTTPTVAVVADSTAPGAAPATPPLDNVAVATPAATPVTATPAKAQGAGEAADADPILSIQQFLSGASLRTALPTLTRNGWNFIRSSVGGFLGVFGFLLSLVIVPIYLYYFLIESRNISESWGDYVPLRASQFKDEVVDALEEINGYLIAFFRGQLLVSMINGTATGIGLMIVGLDFGLLIGLLLCFLGLIPYLGIVMCWIPAVLIASFHGDAWFLHGSAWWVFPMIVTLIFAAVQQIDGLFLTPKIVGESVGLHPMTVIVSVFVWSLLMGGLLGAILAVPMTATIKVLLKRYIWQRKFLTGDEPLFATEETFAVQQAQFVPGERDL